MKKLCVWGMVTEISLKSGLDCHHKTRKHLIYVIFLFIDAHIFMCLQKGKSKFFFKKYTVGSIFMKRWIGTFAEFSKVQPKLV